MSTQPNLIVSILMALIIHVVGACIVLWTSDDESVQLAEISQGIEIKLDRNAYKNILQEQHEKQQQEAKQVKVEPAKPKKEKPEKEKPKKVKEIQQKAVLEIPKEKVVAYKVQEQVAEKEAPVTEEVDDVQPETVKVASISDKPSQVALANEHQQSPEGEAGAQKPIDMSDDSTKQYIAQLMRHLSRYKQYPAILKKNHVEGKPVIRFSINKSGQVTLIEVKKHTEYAELDQAAMDVFRRASPLPKIPSELERETLTMSLPIEYSLIND